MSKVPTYTVPLNQIPSYISNLMQDMTLLTNLSFEKFGNIGRIKIGPKNIYVIVDEDYIRVALTDYASKLRPSSLIRFFQQYLGTSLTGMEILDPDHTKLRQLVINYMGTQPIKKLFSKIYHGALKYVEKLQSGQIIDLNDWAFNQVINNHLELVAGNHGLTSEELLQLTGTLGDVTPMVKQRAIFHGLADRLHPGMLNDYNRGVAIKDKLLAKIIDQGFDGGNGVQNLLALMVERHNTDQDLTREEMEGTVLSLLLGGQGSTVGAIVTAIFNLYKNPDYLAAARKEVAEVLGNNVGSNKWSADMSFPFLEAVIKETLRIARGVPLGIREPIEDLMFGEYLIPKGSIALLSYYNLHMRADIYPNPTKFDPYRFYGENKLKLGKFQYLPYGGGPRSCVGSGYANIEILTILVLLIQTGISFNFQDEHLTYHMGPGQHEVKGPVMAQIL